MRLQLVIGRDTQLAAVQGIAQLHLVDIQIPAYDGDDQAIVR